MCDVDVVFTICYSTHTNERMNIQIDSKSYAMSFSNGIWFFRCTFNRSRMKPIVYKYYTDYSGRIYSAEPIRPRVIYVMSRVPNKTLLVFDSWGQFNQVFPFFGSCVDLSRDYTHIDFRGSNEIRAVYMKQQESFPMISYGESEVVQNARMFEYRNGAWSASIPLAFEFTIDTNPAHLGAVISVPHYQANSILCRLFSSASFERQYGVFVDLANLPSKGHTVGEFTTLYRIAYWCKTVGLSILHVVFSHDDNNPILFDCIHLDISKEFPGSNIDVSGFYDDVKAAKLSFLSSVFNKGIQYDNGFNEFKAKLRGLSEFDCWVQYLCFSQYYSVFEEILGLGVQINTDVECEDLDSILNFYSGKFHGIRISGLDLDEPFQDQANYVFGTFFNTNGAIRTIKPCYQNQQVFARAMSFISCDVRDSFYKEFCTIVNGSGRQNQLDLLQQSGFWDSSSLFILDEEASKKLGNDKILNHKMIPNLFTNEQRLQLSYLTPSQMPEFEDSEFDQQYPRDQVMRYIRARSQCGSIATIFFIRDIRYGLGGAPYKEPAVTIDEMIDDVECNTRIFRFIKSL